MLEKFTKIISYIFHPLIIPTLGFLVLFNSGTYLSYVPFEVKKWMMVSVILSTYLIPVLFVQMLLQLGVIMNLEMKDKKERAIPLAVSFILTLFCLFLMKWIHAPDMFATFLMATLVSMLISLLVNVYARLSLHMVGIGGLVGLIGFISFYLQVNLLFYLTLSIALSGVIGYSRLRLNAHSPLQVYLGFVTGLANVVLVLVVF